MAVALRHADINRQIGTARKRRHVIDGEPPTLVLLGQKPALSLAITATYGKILLITGMLPR